MPFQVVWLATSEIRSFACNDAVHLGLRVTVGLIFIVHSLGKFEPGFAGAVAKWGLPPEMQIPIALAELVPGVLLIFGVLTRFSGALLAIVMVCAIFIVLGAESFTGDGGVEYNTLLIAASLLIMVAGPGRASLAHLLQRVPRLLH